MPDFSRKFALVANGHIENYANTARQLSEFSHIIAVDGGLDHCHKMNIRPFEIVGDLDSVTPKTLDLYRDIPLHQYPFDKNETDLELAIARAKPSSDNHVVVYGAMGLRMDHSVANLYLLARYPGCLSFESDTEIIFAIDGTCQINTHAGQIISLLPLGEPVEGVQTSGLRWELNNATLNSSFLSVSNECLGSQVAISTHSGTLLCYLQR
ncbi:MAG: thiamine diphosphokinase [Chlamydiales bacterium]|nr:thiamine diphosphokinase [Chlamydiales bacterium]